MVMKKTNQTTNNNKKPKERKDYLLEIGTVIAILGNSVFRVKCKNGSVVNAYITSEFRRKRKRGQSIKIIEGSTVRMKISTDDLSQGNIVSFVDNII